MFGHDWDNAEATIVARDAKFTGDGSVVTYTYLADVRLRSGEIFRATVHEPTIATDFWAPSPRDVVSVLVKAKDRKVKFDKDDERLSVRAYEAAKKKTFRDAQTMPAGTPTSGWSSSAELPEAIASRLAQLGIAGSAQVINADSVQGRDALAAFADLGKSGVPTPEGRLDKLNALQERGLVSAAEYAEQRRRILDEI